MGCYEYSNPQKRYREYKIDHYILELENAIVYLCENTIVTIVPNVKEPWFITVLKQAGRYGIIDSEQASHPGSSIFWCQR